MDIIEKEFVNEENIFSEDNFKLVLSISKRGFESDILEAAKSVGTSGGILIQAKGISKSQKKFLGINISPDDTVVMILVKDELVVPTIKAIYSVIDFKSEAHGMVFALPVSSVAGMNETNEKTTTN